MTSQELPKGYEVIKFGEIAQQCKESVDRENNSFDKYVEGGHMDSNNLRISRWGTFGDQYVGPAFHRIFRKGQILYGSRRTYLKKIAIADFDGITANTTFVIEPKINEKFYAPLLPFIMLSDSFTSYSVGKSKGSTNPYINWKDLCDFEIILPSIDRQKTVYKILSKSQEVVFRGGEVGAALEKASEIIVEGKISELDAVELSFEELLKAGDIIDIQDGNHGNDHPKASEYVEVGIPFVMASDLKNGVIDPDGCKKLPKKRTDSLRIGFSLPGDVLLSHKGTVGLVALAPEVKDYLMLTPQVTYYRLSPNGRVKPKYLEIIFKSSGFQKNLKALAAQSTRAYIGINAQKKIKVKVPSKEAQDEVILLWEALQAVKKKNTESKNMALSVAENIINGWA